MTTWRPDTCGCVFRLKEDVTLESVVERCPVHTGWTDVGLFSQVVGENRRKGKVLGLAVRAAGLEAVLALDAEMKNILSQYQDNSIEAQFRLSDRVSSLTAMEKSQVSQLWTLQRNFQWSFDAFRALNVSLDVGLTAIQKTALQDLCDAQFGANKVKVA